MLKNENILSTSSHDKKEKAEKFLLRPEFKLIYNHKTHASTCESEIEKFSKYINYINSLISIVKANIHYIKKNDTITDEVCKKRNKKIKDDFENFLLLKDELQDEFTKQQNMLMEFKKQLDLPVAERKIHNIALEKIEHYNYFHKLFELIEKISLNNKDTIMQIGSLISNNELQKSDLEKNKKFVLLNLYQTLLAYLINFKEEKLFNNKIKSLKQLLVDFLSVYDIIVNINYDIENNIKKLRSTNPSIEKSELRIQAIQNRIKTLTKIEIEAINKTIELKLFDKLKKEFDISNKFPLLLVYDFIFNQNKAPTIELIVDPNLNSQADNLIVNYNLQNVNENLDLLQEMELNHIEGKDEHQLNCNLISNHASFFTSDYKIDEAQIILPSDVVSSSNWVESKINTQPNKLRNREKYLGRQASRGAYFNNIEKKNVEKRNDHQDDNGSENNDDNNNHIQLNN